VRSPFTRTLIHRKVDNEASEVAEDHLELTVENAEKVRWSCCPCTKYLFDNGGQSLPCLLTAHLSLFPLMLIA
jgi:hypothetical protein